MVANVEVLAAQKRVERAFGWMEREIAAHKKKEQEGKGSQMNVHQDVLPLHTVLGPGECAKHPRNKFILKSMYG